MHGRSLLRALRMINEVSQSKGQPGDVGCQPNIHPKNGVIPGTVWQIGVVMCLMNISFVMAYSFSGLYLKHILGATAISIGVLEELNV